MEAKLKPTAERLRDAVSAKLGAAGEISASGRASISQILRQTVPDPAEIGLIG